MLKQPLAIQEENVQNRASSSEQLEKGKKKRPMSSVKQRRNPQFPIVDIKKVKKGKLKKVNPDIDYSTTEDHDLKKKSLNSNGIESVKLSPNHENAIKEQYMRHVQLKESIETEPFS